MTGLADHLGWLLAQTSSSGGAISSQSLMIWAIVAFGIALILLGAEAFVPSGGILGFSALLSAVLGIILFFWFDTTWGMVSLAFSLAAFPFVVTGLLWIAPNTFVGRMMTLDNQQIPITLAAGGEGAPGAVAVGVQGTAETDLRPIGTCRLEGHRHDCISELGIIPAGSDVEVIAADGTSIRVRIVNQSSA